MIAGDCGIGATTVFDTQGYRSRVAAEVDMQAVDEGTTPLERLAGRVSTMAPADSMIHPRQ